MRRPENHDKQWKNILTAREAHTNKIKHNIHPV